MIYVRRKVGNCGEDGDDMYNFKSSRSSDPIGELTENDGESAETELQPVLQVFSGLRSNLLCFLHSVEP